ncbi:hypothetical protein F443_00602, partial [Phytophthora nicotianae P1569]
MSLLLKDVQKGNLAYNKIRDLILGMIDPLAFIVQSRKGKPSRRHGGKPDQQRTDGQHQSPGASADSTRTTG